MRTLQVVSDTTTSVVIAPALYVAEPTTNWLDAVAVASRPKIVQPEKLPLFKTSSLIVMIEESRTAIA